MKGYRNDVQIEFKSKMEANIFRWLKTRKLELVEYEPELFYFKPNKYGIKAYVPDFKITDGKRIWYIEVKGVFEKQDLEKIRLFERDYPWCRIYIIDSEKYNLIKKYYSKDIMDWE